ncbi:MAG TPA: SCO family protein [Gaiellaceae bacterium]|nr:SCO family protein [Gaiellaceae bacterium]
MSVQQPTAAAGSPPRYLRWALWASVALLGVLGGLLIGLVLLSRHSTPVANGPVGPVGPAASWAAGTKLAPGFTLTDQSGKPVSLAAYRGRPVIVTFIDPLCRNFCPLEAKVLNDVESRLPAAQRPAIVAVSVNLWANKRSYLLQDVRKWQLTPEWRWGVGDEQRLSKVWSAYQITVLAQTRKIAGVTVHEITHTEGAFIVDPTGHQRALFLWPFRAVDVMRTLRQLSRA